MASSGFSCGVSCPAGEEKTGDFICAGGDYGALTKPWRKAKSLKKKAFRFALKRGIM